MKLHSLPLIAGLALTAFAAAGESHVHWLETRHSFGTIAEEDGLATCTFRLVNDGPEPAAIVAARATCGCTRPKYPTASIAPGDTAVLEVSYDPKARPGRFEKSITVETSATPRKTRLEISGIVVATTETVALRYPVDFGSLRLAHGTLMLGEVTKGQIKTVYADAYNAGNDSLRITVASKPRWADVIPSPEAVSPGEQITLVTYVNSGRCDFYGMMQDTLVLATDEGQFTVPVTITVNEDFTGLDADKMQNAPMSYTDSDFVDLGDISRSGGPVGGSFTLGNVGHDRLEIRRIYSYDDGITVVQPKDSSIKKGKKTTVGVTVDPTQPPAGIINATVTVVTNDPMQPMRSIRIVGRIVE